MMTMDEREMYYLYQQWQIVAPHQRQTLNRMGTLGEGLFDGSPSRLVGLLAVPVIPSDFYLDRGERPALSSPRYFGD